MSRIRAVTLWTEKVEGAEEAGETWRPTTLDKLGKSEAFLEDVLAKSPDLLGLRGYHSGIQQSFRVFPQRRLTSPTERTNRPDLVLLSGDGHIVLVEVKLGSNPELKNRDVIGQIVDYAASFPSLNERDLIKLFGQKVSWAETWSELIATLFPENDDSEELAAALFERIQSGKIHLAIACDRIPPGVAETVANIAAQQALGEFTLDLIEVVPFVCDNMPGKILFVPTPRLTTEIVARTVVTLKYPEGDSRPFLDVRTTSVEEIAQNVEKTRQGAISPKRSWTHEEIEQACRENAEPAALHLFEFAKKYSASGRVTSGDVHARPTFNFYVKGRMENGKEKEASLLVYGGGDSIKFYFDNSVNKFVSQEIATEYRSRLKGLFVGSIYLDKPEPTVLLSDLTPHLEQLCRLLLWVQEQVNLRLDGGEAA